MEEKAEVRKLTSAASAVNCLLSKENNGLTNIKLNKLVYIAHGFCLAHFGKPILNAEYNENVQAWKYGPVIPTIYHEFKRFGKNVVSTTQKACLASEDPADGINVFEPELEDSQVIKVLDFVYREYGSLGAGKLIEITHQEGTPWRNVFKNGEFDVVISDESTKAYYIGLIKHLKDNNIDVPSKIEEMGA